MRFLDAAILELRFFHFLFLERGIIEQAGNKTDGKKKIVARGKVHSGQFATDEMHILQSGLAQLDEGEITILESTIEKIVSRQIRFFEIATLENTGRKFTSAQLPVGVIHFFKGFVFVECFVHVRKRDGKLGLGTGSWDEGRGAKSGTENGTGDESWDGLFVEERSQFTGVIGFYFSGEEQRQLPAAQGTFKPFLFLVGFGNDGRNGKRCTVLINGDKSVDGLIASFPFTGNGIFHPHINENFHGRIERARNFCLEGDNARVLNGGMERNMIDRCRNHNATAMTVCSNCTDDIHPFHQPSAEKVIQVVRVVRKNMMGGNGKRLAGGFRIHAVKVEVRHET